MSKKPPKIVITVRGGMVSAVHANAIIDVTLRDWDNIDAGDADPLEEFHNEETDETDWDGAGYPHEVF